MKTYDRRYVDAYRAGERARDTGEQASDNPYSESRWQERFMWFAGWAHRARMQVELVGQRSAILQEQAGLGI